MNMCVFVCVLVLVHTAHVLRTFMRLNSVLNILIYGIWPYMRRFEWWFMISFFARYIFARANAPSMCSVCIRWGIDKSLTHKYLNPITFATLFFPSLPSFQCVCVWCAWYWCLCWPGSVCVRCFFHLGSYIWFCTFRRWSDELVR